jgi:hypothetical protein
MARTPGRVDAEPATLKAAERSHIRKILMQANGAISGPNGAPAHLGLKRSTLYGRMQKLGIPLPTKNPLSSKMISCSSGSGFVCHEDSDSSNAKHLRLRELESVFVDPQTPDF